MFLRLATVRSDQIHPPGGNSMMPYNPPAGHNSEKSTPQNAAASLFPERFSPNPAELWLIVVFLWSESGQTH